MTLVDLSPMPSCQRVKRRTERHRNLGAQTPPSKGPVPWDSLARDPPVPIKTGGAENEADLQLRELERGIRMRLPR